VIAPAAAPQKSAGLRTAQSLRTPTISITGSTLYPSVNCRQIAERQRRPSCGAPIRGDEEEVV
jgi:hypothetical protein